MKTIKQYPSQDELNALFDYNPETGVLTWKVRRSNRINIGDIVGWLSEKGYLLVTLSNKHYRIHRIIWIMNNGEIPQDFQIDHINGIKADNRLSNLRLATNSQNQCNVFPQKNNRSNVKGLCELIDKKSGKKYWACEVEISRFTNRCRKRKTFPFTESTKESQKAVAIAWLERTRAELHGEFTNHGTSHNSCLKSPTP